DAVVIDIGIRPRDIVVRWRADVTTATGVTRMRHSTLGGMLLTREDLKSQHPDSRPTLTPRGRARRTLLELCDGDRSVAEIERELQRRHPDLFPSSGGAQAFVAEVVAGYGVFE